MAELLDLHLKAGEIDVPRTAEKIDQESAESCFCLVLSRVQFSVYCPLLMATRGTCQCGLRR